jgi:hypothetical protein
MDVPIVVTLSLLTLGLCGYAFRAPRVRRILQSVAVLCEIAAVGVAIWGFGRIFGG